MNTDLNINRQNPSSIHKPTGYSHVVETTSNKTIYISGQVALDKDGNLVGENDLRLQARQVFENLKNALESFGASFDNLVKLTYFLVDMSQIQFVRDVRDSYISADKV